MNNVFIGLGILATTALASAQEPIGDPKLTRRAIAESAARLPLTQGELISNVNRLEKIMRRVAGLAPAKGQTMPAQPDSLATRTQLVFHLNRLFEDTQPKFKFTPRMLSYQPQVITLPASNPQRKNAENLIKWGFVNRVSPILTGKSENITLRDFGEAMGLFVIRSSELLHVPSSKFSPYLMPGG